MLRISEVLPSCDPNAATSAACSERVAGRATEAPYAAGASIASASASAGNALAAIDARRCARGRRVEVVRSPFTAGAFLSLADIAPQD